jgi:uncharacterized protein YndB with AHSA1/START domain
MNADRAVEVSVHIAAEPETVFPYFTDPVRYVQWMGAGAVLELVPGGCYRIVMRDGVEAAGEFVEIDPPRRLVFTWGWTHDRAVPPGTTRVVVTLAAERGGTRVILRHYGLPDDGQRDHHRAGWEFCLGRSRSVSRVAIPARTPTPDRRTPSAPARGTHPQRAARSGQLRLDQPCGTRLTTRRRSVPARKISRASRSA